MTAHLADPSTAPLRPGAGPLLAAAAPDLAGHERRYGPLPWRGAPGRLLSEVAAAGLTGRGGAAFPTWRKLAAGAAGRRTVVVGNAAEGEPASVKDATLLVVAPHLVLDGLQLAAEAVDAAGTYLCLGAGPAAAGMRRVLDERAAAGRDRHQVVLHEVPDRFVAGEASALVASLEGRPALPSTRDVPLAGAGLRGRPTVVQNVETLAHLALIGRDGAAGFRRAGTPDQPGTFLATVRGAVAAPGVVEAPYGIPLGELLTLAGGPSRPLSAVLVGGYAGGWLPADPGLAVPVSRAGLASWDASPGAGVVVALSRSDCGLAATSRILDYLAAQSAGQCGPCLNGLPALAATVGRLAAGSRDPRIPAQVRRLSALVTGRGACHHPDDSARMVRTALRTFAADVRAHLAGACTAR